MRFSLRSTAFASDMGEAASVAEAAGYDEIGYVDTQNRRGDCFVGLAAAAIATTNLGLATAVTNPVTRHPAATAAAFASLHALSDGRAIAGVGRGDSALADIGSSPATVARLAWFVGTLRSYLRGEAVEFETLTTDATRPVETLKFSSSESTSRLGCLREDLPPVPVEVYASGPKAIECAALYADGIVLSVGADIERIRWGIQLVRTAREMANLDPDAFSIGAVINTIVSDDAAYARSLGVGALSTQARFAAMYGTVSGPASNHMVGNLERIVASYDMNLHAMTTAPQAKAMDEEFINAYGIFGSAQYCAERLRSLECVGVEKVIIIGPSHNVELPIRRDVEARFAEEVIPALA